ARARDELRKLLDLCAHVRDLQPGLRFSRATIGVHRAISDRSSASVAAGEASGQVSKPAVARRWRTSGSAGARAAAARSAASAGSGVPGRVNIMVQTALS